MEIPVLTLGETFMKPSTMLYRNLLAMDAEEALRAYPADGVVLLGGCDKTVPALMMGATSANLPAIFVPAGPMLRGNWRGQILGSGTDAWKYWDEKRAGLLDDCAWREIEDGIARSFGTCMTMGTASTMASTVDALGLTLPGASSIPAADSQHPRMASAGGLRAVLTRLRDLLNVDCVTVTGRTLGEEIEGAAVCNDDVIATREAPLGPEGGVAVLRGNLAPDGAVIKHTAADKRLLRHAGPAVVFSDYNDLERRLDDPALPVTAESVLVLQNAGPLGG